MPSALPKQLYPEVTRIFKIQKEVSGEIKNYRKIAKKYNKAQTATHYVAVSLGCLWAAPSASGIALTLTGPGIIVGAPLRAEGAFCGTGSARPTNLSKKLSLKLTKHEKINSLALSKRNSINALVSKSLIDGVVTDREVIINSEVEQYFKLKETVRAKIKEKTSPGPDFEKMKKEQVTSRQRILKKVGRQINSFLNFHFEQIQFLDNACSILCFGIFSQQSRNSKMAKRNSFHNRRGNLGFGGSEKAFYCRICFMHLLHANYPF